MRGSVVSLFVIVLCTVAAADKYWRCGRNFGNQLCPPHSCCSQWGYCGLTPANCDPAQQCQSYCWTSDGGADNVIARYEFYDEWEIKWNMTAAHVACASVDANKSLKWRSKFPWAAFCGSVGPQGLSACGKCVRLLHPRQLQGRNVHVVVRIVDTCRYGAFVLDHAAFNQLDFDGEGFRNGYLQVNYRFINCEDAEKDFLSIV